MFGKGSRVLEFIYEFEVFLFFIIKFSKLFYIFKYYYEEALKRGRRFGSKV